MIPYNDMHCDTLMKAWEKRKDTFYEPGGHISLPDLKEGGCKTQFFAIFMMPQPMNRVLQLLGKTDEAYIKRNLEIFHNTLEAYPHMIAQAKGKADINDNWKNGKISAVLTLEDGRYVDGKMERIQWLYEEGIRLISLTWNYKNCFGSPNSKKKELMEEGLTEFGKEAIGYMNDLGILVDVSHLSDGGFWDVARLSQKPFVASHSNCRSLNPHTRSMTDDMIKALANKGGVMGVNFAPQFLNQNGKEQVSRIEDIVRQLQHMVQVGGEECAAIGTDFDGIGGKLEIASPKSMPLLMDALEKAGFSQSQIEKIAYKNVERVLT